MARSRRRSGSTTASPSSSSPLLLVGGDGPGPCRCWGCDAGLPDIETRASHHRACPPAPGSALAHGEGRRPAEPRSRDERGAARRVMAIHPRQPRGAREHLESLGVEHASLSHTDVVTMSYALRGWHIVPDHDCRRAAERFGHPADLEDGGGLVDSVVLTAVVQRHLLAGRGPARVEAENGSVSGYRRTHRRKRLRGRSSPPVALSPTSGDNPHDPPHPQHPEPQPDRERRSLPSRAARSVPVP